MPLDPSIALQGQGVNPANAISSFLDLGLKKTALTRQKATLEADIEAAKANSATAQAGAQVATANVTPLIQQQKAITQAAETGAERGRFQFRKEQAETAFQELGGLIQNPAIVDGKDGDAAVLAILDAKKRAIAKGIPEPIAEVMFSKFVNQAHDSPQTLRQTLADTMQGGMSAPQQVSQNLVPAGGQQQPGGADVRGNATVQLRDQFGNLKQAPLPQAAPQPQQAAPLQFPAGENPATYKLLNDEREAARTTIAAAPTVHALNREILSELDKTATGQYAGFIAKAQSLAGMLGLSLSGTSEEERAASAYDLVDKYTTQAATRAAQSMGNDTATALTAQIKQNASVERNPTAIRKSIKFNDAVLSGAEAYQAGLEKAIQANPQADIFIKRKFDQEWARNFDPVIMQIYQAKKDGDKAELADLVKGLGGRATEILRKAQRLQELSQRGM